MEIHMLPTMQSDAPVPPRTIENTFILGCSGLAGLFRRLDDETVDEIVRVAVEKYGITVMDTAPHYGLGFGEERLGSALLKVLQARERHRGEGGACSAIKIYTKVGRVIHECPVTELDSSKFDIEHSNLPGPENIVFPDTPENRTPVFDYSYEGVIRSFEDSARRLQVAALAPFNCRLVGLRLHDFHNPRHMAAAKSEGLAGLVHIRDELMAISDVSIGINRPISALEIVSSASKGKFNSAMLANSWNLLDHPVESLQLFQKCEELDIEVHLAGIFASGALVGRDSYKYAKIDDPVIARKIQDWTLLCEEHGLHLPIVAISFALLAPAARTKVAIGVGSVSELEEVMQWFSSSLSNVVPKQLWQSARERGLLAEYVSV
jgi:D-threo-aldose 1-dehydrogenase